MDTQLMKQCRQGDKAAFSTLVRPYLQRAYSTAFTILGTQHAAEDAVQNALLEAYRSIMEEKDIHQFSAWFVHLVTCRALDLARQKSKQRTTEEADLLELRDEKASPADRLLQKESRSEMLQAIMRLNINQRAVIVMHYYQEMKIGEIAALLNIKEGTVKSRLHQARLTLSKLVSFEAPKQKVGECQ
ncbi:RNA polymerase sigma factor [Aneurinibacillus sp. BA2021]|nr:RNA polymerase sigma factor [Aneurinibacillus sp. BA2021]